MYCRVLGLTLALGALAAPAAHAEQTPLGFAAASLDVAMTTDGAAHVGYLDGKTLKVCRIAPAASTCTASEALGLVNADANAQVGRPIVLTDGMRVTVVIANGTGAQAQTYATTSATGAPASYSPLGRIADLQAEDATLSADGQRIVLTAQRGSASNADDYLAIGSAPLPGAGPATAGSVLAGAAGGRSLGDYHVGLRPDGKPVAILSGSTPDRGTGDFLWAFAGTDGNDPVEVNDSSEWAPPASFAPAAGADKTGGDTLAAGAGALWLGYQAAGADVALRKWNGTAFGAAVRPDCVARRHGSGSQSAPAVAVASTGDTLTAYVTSDGTNHHLGYIRGNADGTAFSPYQELTTPVARIQDVELAADPDQTRSAGVAVWTDDATSGGPVRFTRLPATTFAACPPPANPTTPGTTNPGTTPTTPTTTTKPKKPALSSVVRGLPSATKCVSRRSFKIRLKHPKSTRIVRGTIKVNGKTKATRKGKRVRARINLKGLPKGRYTVKITLRLADGRTVGYTRKYRTCTPGSKRKRR